MSAQIPELMGALAKLTTWLDIGVSPPALSSLFHHPSSHPDKFTADRPQCHERLLCSLYFTEQEGILDQPKIAPLIRLFNGEVSHMGYSHIGSRRRSTNLSHAS